MDSKILIELAAKKDIDEILQLQKQIYRVDNISPNAHETLLNQIKDETCDVVVVKDNAKILATATIYYINVALRGTPYGLLEGLVVHETHRGKGIGTMFIKKCIEIARDKKCYKLIFTSGDDRSHIHHFYEKLGFKKWGCEFRMDL